jgi:hypothetical protein
MATESACINGCRPEILNIYRDVMIAIDITFVNQVPFFIAVSRGIKFGTVEMLLNPQVKTVKNAWIRWQTYTLKDAFRLP